MIKNERQYKITKSKRDKFLQSLDNIHATKKDDLLKDLMIRQIQSQIESLNDEIEDYEKLKNERPSFLISTIDNIPEALIKARIAVGLSQSQLAEKTGLKEQQIQRYESCDYETASFSRIITIAKSIGVKFNDTKLTLEQDELEVIGFEQSFIREATKKLQSRKSLLTA